MNEENKSKKSVTILVIVLIFIGLVLLAAVKISVEKLTDVIINSNSDSSDDTYVERDYSDWDERFDALESKIDQQSSSLEDVKITLGEINAKTGMGKIKIQIIPKEYAESTKVTVTIGEYSTELKLKKHKFMGEIETPFREIYDFVYVTMETDGKTKNEKIVLSDNDEFYNWDDEILYRVSGDIDYDYDLLEDNQCTIKIDNAYFQVENYEKGNNLPILYITKNNTIVFQNEMQYNEKAGEYQGKYKETFEVGYRDQFKCYVEYTGKSGLKYRVNYFDMNFDKDGCESLEVDEDGSIVYDLNNNKIKFKYMDEDEE